MKLYYAPNACSLSPHIVLRESGIPFKMERVDLQKKTTESGVNFLHINPKGSVPVLELDDSVRLTEGPAIVQYIADMVPKTKLAPEAGTFDRYRLQEWLNFISSEMHKTLSPLFSENTPVEYKKMVLETITKRFDFLEKHFSKHRYLMGETFTVADAYLFTIMRWTKYFKIDLKPWPSLVKFMDKVNERPAVQTALHAEEIGK